MNYSLRSLIAHYLKAARLMQIATARSNQPWACTVYFAFDDTFHLYWISRQDRRHSQELRENNRVAGTVVLPHTPGDKVRGIQFEGTAQELSKSTDIDRALSHYSKRYGLSTERQAAIKSNNDGHVCYEITPTLIVLFDEENFPKDSRREYYPDQQEE